MLNENATINKTNKTDFFGFGQQQHATAKMQTRRHRQDQKQEQKQDQTAKEPYNAGTLLLNAVQAVRLLEQLDDAQLIAELQEHTQLTAELVKFVVDKIKKSKSNYDSVFFLKKK